MYLKSIEVQGFKSFANKMTFEFHDGITAIVGPNGSGKSNVADAVRWVLGEQSAKQLRGSRMEDVIFSGTEARKPLGYAYVAITLDNSDHKLATSYEEVTVARRLYRSGESDYLINGVSGTLRSVQELFLDTGIGKEGYSIIGQGQIDKILSGKPEDRRSLFDEAAGIVKFKKRKVMAEKNLEAERANLCRIQDILREIETQIKPLEKQSETAKIYLQYHDELKTLDVNMFVQECDRITNELSELEKKTEIASNDLKDVNKEYESTKAEYKDLEAELETLNANLDEKNKTLTDSKLKREQLANQILILKEKILSCQQNSAHFKENAEKISKEIEEKQKGIRDILKEKEANDTLVAEIIAEQQSKDDALKELQQNIAICNEDIENRNNEKMNSMKSMMEIQSNMERYKEQLEQNTIKKAQLSQKVLEIKSNAALLEENMQKRQEELTVVSDRILVLTSNNEELTKDLKEAEETRKNIRLQLDKNYREYHANKSKLESLKNIAERYEGYGNSIRNVMEMKKTNKGIIGVIADIIKVEKDYETAIETALGGTIQNIVTEDEQTAKEMITYLKKNRLGRATFLPLSTVSQRGKFQHEDALKEKGVIGLASELVHAESRFDGLIGYLLGRILVVDHIDNAIAIARKYRQSFKIVTREGDVMNPGGSMSGGSYRNNSNLLGRRREMEDLEKILKDLSEQEKEFKKQEQDSTLKYKKVSEVIERNKDKIQELYLEQNTAKIKYDQAVSDKEENDKELEGIREGTTGVEDEIRRIKSAIVAEENSLEHNKKKRQDNENQIKEQTDRYEELNKAEEKLRKELEDVHLKVASKQQQASFIDENLSRMNNEVEDLMNQLKELNESAQDGDSLVVEKQEEILQVEQAVKDFEDKILRTSEEIEEIKKTREANEQTHKGFFEKREALSEEMSRLDKECFRLNNQAEKLNEQMERSKNYMWENYELTYSNALPLKTDTDLTLPQIKKEVSELKQKIKGLGSVNVNAIEDYKALSERHSLLRTQHDDLIESEEAILKIIAELDEEMRKQFSEKFHDIQVQFDKVFKELFGGGKGTLELMDGDDILETGILITAQPPGKALKNMAQLSGGEKALTAIALLFAIQNLKPSPFCLLDEIEAALDDSNVTRYANYLHKLTKDTQFIVITHRRGTMNAADRLYGITMQEKGVSTLVSVNLLEDELDD
ncbi:MAG: chromosome segregation protein SMC [Lachnospiraceae bacterium]|nr:chromosome segregation protein SMC [Lachnospiraceae bacterium]